MDRLPRLRSKRVIFIVSVSWALTLDQSYFALFATTSRAASTTSLLETTTPPFSLRVVILQATGERWWGFWVHGIRYQLHGPSLVAEALAEIMRHSTALIVQDQP